MIAQYCVLYRCVFLNDTSEPLNNYKGCIKWFLTEDWLEDTSRKFFPQWQKPEETFESDLNSFDVFRYTYGPYLHKVILYIKLSHRSSISNI